MEWVRIPPAEWLETENEVIDAFTYLNLKPKISYDTETTGLISYKDYPLLLSFSDGERRFGCDAEFLHHPLIKHALTNEKTIKRITNAKFDMHMTENAGIRIGGPVHCTVVMDHQYNENRKGRHGLKETARDYCNIIMREFTDVFPMIRKRKGFPDDTPADAIRRKMSTPEGVREAREYAGLDAYATYKVAEYLEQQLSLIDIQPGFTLYDYFERIEAPFTKVLYLLERRGISICSGYFKQIEVPIQKAILEIEHQFNIAAKQEINISSPIQLREFFYDVLGKTPTKWTSGGASGNKQPATDIEVLEGWAEEGDVFANMVMQHRKLSKIYETYVVGLSDLLDNNFKLHTSLNQSGTVTGRLSSSNPNCFHPSTEILTNRGWVLFPELNENDLVAQWDDGTISFEHAKKIQYKFNGDLVLLENEHINLFTTPDHRCLIANRKTDEIKVVNAIDYPEDYKQYNAGNYEKILSVKDCENLTKRQLRIICAIQADGYYHDGGVDFKFKKKRKINRLLDLLENSSLDFTHGPADNGRYRIRILKSKELDYLKSFLGSNKSFDSWILGLDREYLDTFIEEVNYWDGCITRMNNYSSNIKQNADWVQIANVLSNKRANLRVYNGTRNLNYQVDITNRNYSLTTNISKTLVPYEGPVYCVTVPSSFIIIRRKGKVSITGNCQNIPRPGNDKFKLRDGFVSTPGKKLIVADYGQLEMRIMAHKAGDPIMIEAIVNGKDLHCLAVSLIFGFPYEDVIGAKKAEKKGIELTSTQKRLLELRQAMKNVGFGIIYGIGAQKLGHDLTEEFKKSDKDRIVTEAEAQSYIDAWYGLFTTVRHYVEWQKKYVRDHGYVQTFLGRYRRLPEIKSSRYKEKLKAERQAVNIIQGDAADIVKIAMIAIEEDTELQSWTYEQLLQIHDEIVGECNDEDSLVENCLLRVKDHMENSFERKIYKLKVPLDVEINSGYTWSTAK